MVDGPQEATLAQEAVVHTNQGDGLRPCSPSAMRARLGGVRQPHEHASGKSEVGLGVDVSGSPPVAGKTILRKRTVRMLQSSSNGGKTKKRVGTRTRYSMSGTV